MIAKLREDLFFSMKLFGLCGGGFVLTKFRTSTSTSTVIVPIRTVVILYVRLNTPTERDSILYLSVGAGTTFVE